MSESRSTAAARAPTRSPRPRPNAPQEVAPGIWCSPGLSNTYLLTTADGRVVVNTGMGFEGQVHRANFDAVDSSPIRYIIVTQGHYDHVGGLDTMRDPDTQVVAQANWRQWRDDNERLADLPGQQQRLRVHPTGWRRHRGDPAAIRQAAAGPGASRRRRRGRRHTRVDRRRAHAWS